MNHRFAFSLLLFFLYVQVKAQDAKDHKDALFVRYSSRFNIDYERGRSFREFHSVLYNGSSFSEFYMLPVSNSLSAPEQDLQVLIDVDTLFRVVKDIEGSTAFFSDLGLDGRVRYYRDSLNPMTWELVDEIKDIDGLECHKAVTIFRGRSYTAWYAPDIPIGNGPWKLGGLPGLIVEAYEDNQDLYFHLTGIAPVPSTDLKAPSLLKRNGLPGYDRYISYWRESIEVLQGSMLARESPDCISCHINTKVRFHSWEKIPDL